MAKRARIAPRKSKRLFTKAAKKVNKKNGGQTVMRGGIRL